MVSRLLPLTIRPIQTRFRFGYVTLHHLTLPEKVTRRFIMQKARSHSSKAAPTACRQTGSGSIALLCSRFFSPFPHGTGSLSVSREYLALRDGPRQFTQDVSCPALLRCSVVYGSICRIRSFHALRPYFPVGSPISIIKLLSKSYYPDFAETKPVWANPRSLATTEGITFVFFSYG